MFLASETILGMRNMFRISKIKLFEISFLGCQKYVSSIKNMFMRPITIVWGSKEYQKYVLFQSGISLGICFRKI